MSADGDRNGRRLVARIFCKRDGGLGVSEEGHLRGAARPLDDLQQLLSCP